MNRPRPNPPTNMVEWFKVMGIVCGGLIATGTVLGFLWKTLNAQIMVPVTTAVAQERSERIAGDAAIVSRFDVTDAKLDEIHRLLVHPRRRSTGSPDHWTQGALPKPEEAR